MRRRSLLAASAMRAVTEVNAYAYARVGQQLYMSTNCGQTWAVRDSNIRTVGGLCVDVDGEALATGETSMWDFTLAGSYNSRPCTGTPQSICQSSGSEYIFYSTNAGSGWQTGYSTTIYKKQGLAGTPTAVKTFSTWDQASNDMVCSENGKNIILGGKAGFTNCFYSVDYGATWAETAATQSVGAGCNQVDISNDGMYCMVAMTDGLWFSSRGPAYLARTGSAKINSCAVSGDGNTMYYDTDSGIYRSFDKGASWTKLTSTYGFSKICTSYLGERLVGVGSSSTAIWYSSNFGNTWAQVGYSGTTDIVLNKFRKF